MRESDKMSKKDSNINDSYGFSKVSVSWDIGKYVKPLENFYK